MDSITLSPVGLFLQAGPVGKTVMILLLGASVWCWILIIEAVAVLARLSRTLRADTAGGLMEEVEGAGRDAARLAIPGETVGERRHRVAEAMHRAARARLTEAEGGLPNLAVIASVAPFVGLFGTVWGIMTSFVGIAATKDTSLATVAPGIAEALAATAYGLVAAIPASIGYSRLGAGFARRAERIGHVVDARAVLIAAGLAERPAPEDRR